VTAQSRAGAIGAVLVFNGEVVSVSLVLATSCWMRSANIRGLPNPCANEGREHPRPANHPVLPALHRMLGLPGYGAREGYPVKNTSRLAPDC
jgi:hypothetical protein